MNKLVSPRRITVEHYQRIPVETLRIGTVLPFGLFQGSGGRTIRLLTSGEVFGARLYERLLRAGAVDLYIEIGEMETYLRYLDFYRLHGEQVMYCEHDGEATAFYHSTSSAIAELFEKGGNDRGLISRVRMIAETTLSEVIGCEKSIKALMRVCSHDYYTYTHSLDVAIYAIGIGMSLGMDRETIIRLSFSALMHDIGKCRLSIKILNKNGRLSDSEFEEMKAHPGFGYEILLKNGERDRDILSGVKYHHERFGGGGYPDNLQGRDIPLFARVVAVADIFNALTTRRSYKPALSSFDAFSMMKRSMGEHLDPEVLNPFIAFMGRGQR